MARNKTKEVEEVVARDSATVTWNGGERTYTREMHGDDFEALAEEFAGKKDGVVA